MTAPWVVILIVDTFILAGLGLYAWRRRTIPGARSFGLLMLAIATWSLAYALELVSQGLLAKMLWIRVEYVGIAAVPALWLAFALQYTGRGGWLSRRNTVLLAAIPALILLLVWTNGAHHLFYRQTVIDRSSGWPLLHIEYGPWFWVNALFSYACLALGTLLLAAGFYRSSAVYRGQAGVLLLGALIPWLGNAIYLVGLVPWPDLDPTPLVFALSGLVLAYGLFRYKLLQIVPVARRAVIEGMPAAMIVLDAEGRIADLNPAARQLFGLSERQAIGRPARQVLGPAEVVADFADLARVDTEVARGEGEGRRVYRLTISPLDEQVAGPPARLVLIQDVTAQVRAQEALEQTNHHLALLHDVARVAASTLDLQVLTQTLADTLAQIIGGDGCYITQIEESSGQVLGGAAYGPFRASYPGLRPPPGELTLTESVLKAGRPLAVDDVFHSPYLSPRIAEMFPACSMLALPLRIGERVLGAVLIAFNEPHTFTQEEIAWAGRAVDIAALALENARLFQGVQQIKRNWEATFDAMPDLIALLDREYRIVQVNQAMANMLGVLPAETVGLVCYECIHGTSEPPSFCPHTHLLADGQQHSAEVHEDRLDGDFDVSVSPLYDAGGQVVGAVHVARDITERKRAEAERERLIAELQAALAKVKTLRGLLPICANCKKIRDDQGYWHSVEVYVQDHSEADFSHGICPDCMKELYPWFKQDKT